MVMIIIGEFLGRIDFFRRRLISSLKQWKRLDCQEFNRNSKMQ